MNTVKIFGKVVEEIEGTAFHPGTGEEIPVIKTVVRKYYEYDENGDIVGVGTYDMTVAENNKLCLYSVNTWDGKLNKGGKRKFDKQEELLIKKEDIKNMKKIFGNMYKEHNTVEFRKLA